MFQMVLNVFQRQHVHLIQLKKLVQEMEQMVYVHLLRLIPHRQQLVLAKHFPNVLMLIAIQLLVIQILHVIL